MQKANVIKNLIQKYLDFYGYQSETIYLSYHKVIFFKITPDSIDHNPTIHTMVDEVNEELKDLGYAPTVDVEVWETEEEIVSRNDTDAYTGIRSIVGCY